MTYSESFQKTVEEAGRPGREQVYGLADNVYDIKRDKMIGHIGMHEIDFKPPDIKQTIGLLANSMDTPIAILDSGRGYHFVSLEIMDDEKWLRWRMLCHEKLPGDFPDGICQKCSSEMEIIAKENVEFYKCKICGDDTQLHYWRDLRITPKGGVPIKLVRWIVPRQAYEKGHIYELSMTHAKQYAKEDIFKWFDGLFEFKMVPTTGLKAPYEIDSPHHGGEK